MKNLLFVSVYPFPQDMGSKQHALYFLKALNMRFNVHCLFFMPPDTATPLASELTANGLDPGKTSFSFFQAIAKKNKYAQFCDKILAYPGFYINSATHAHGLNLIRSIMEKQAIDIVHFENFWFAK